MNEREKTVRQHVIGCYGIIDLSPTATPAEAVEQAGVLLRGGARILQLRMKDGAAQSMLEIARALGPVCREAGALFCVNDRVDIALLSEADAVHVGQDDLPPSAVRQIAGSRLILGVSTHSIEQVERAIGGGADYLGFGPIFATTSKRNPSPVRGIERLKAAVRLAAPVPIVALGGITPDSVAEVAAAGAAAVAAIAAVASAEDPVAVVRALAAPFTRASRA